MLAFDSTQLWITLPGLGYLVRPCLSLSYPTPCGAFILCSRVAVQLVFRSFSEWVVPYEAVDLLCSWEDVPFQNLPTLTSWTTLPWLKCFYKKMNQVLPQQATDGGKDIWCQISSNVPNTQYEAQMFIWNGRGVGKWKLGRKLLSSKPLLIPYCKQAGQPPVGNMNTWFPCDFLVTEEAQKCLCSALKPQVRDVFF